MQYSFKNVSGVTVLILRPLSNHGLHLYQVSRKYLEQFQSYQAYTFSILIITMGHNSVIIVYGVTVFTLCTSSDDDLYLYQVLLHCLHLTFCTLAPALPYICVIISGVATYKQVYLHARIL